MDATIRLEELQAVIFDMDGVIINGMPYHARAWQDTFAEIGLQITPAEVYEREGEAGVSAVAHFLKQRGVDATREEVLELIRKKEERFKAIAQVEVFSGVREFLAALKARGKKIALVTGTARHELEISLPKQIQSQFDLIITGDEVERSKPNPEPYLKALKQLEIEAGQAVVVENAPLGVQAARAAGIRCLTVATSVACERLTGAERCFKNIIELAEYLLRQPMPVEI